MTACSFVQAAAGAFRGRLDALTEAQDDLAKWQKAMWRVKMEVPVVGPPTPPLVRRMQLQGALPPDVRGVREWEWEHACRLASFTIKESAAAWRELKAHQADLDEVECRLGLPDLRAAEHRARVAVETLWREIMATSPPDLACAIMKLEVVAGRSDVSEELWRLRDDLRQLSEGGC